MTEGPFGEGEDLLRRDPIHVDLLFENSLSVTMVETAVAERVLPASVPLVRPDFGRSGQLVVRRRSRSYSLDHDVQAFVPTITTRREDHLVMVAKIHGLLFVRSSREIESVVGPYADEWRDVSTTISAYRGYPKELCILESGEGVD